MGNWFTPNVEAYVSKLYGNFDRVLAPSQVMADKLRGLGIDNVHVQRLGVDLTTFNPQHRDLSLRRELGITDTTRLLVFAGRGSREKNLPVLLDCMKRLGKHYHLLLVGSHMPANVPANVSVIDHFCPASEVARLLASADALLHAGDQETFGLVILEAMASAIPVIAVAAGAFTEIVNDQCGRLCTPNDGLAMARTVREVFEVGARQMGLQARAHVEQHYAWDTVVNGLLEHYRAVLGHPMLVRAHA
ncbi:GDP-mannose-dependent alpha-mannosyltransferase [compost metagenome]